MFRGLLIGAAALIASAQAQAAVIYEKTGVVQTLEALPPLGRDPGYYRLTFRAEGAESGGWVVRLFEYWKVTVYENGEIVGDTETTMEFTPYDSVYTQLPGFQRTEFSLPTFRDFRDASLTGTYVEVTLRVFSADFNLFASAPTPFNVTVEMFDAAPVPEPDNWALMIAGFGIAGAAARRAGRPRFVHSFTAASNI